MNAIECPRAVVPWRDQYSLLADVCLRPSSFGVSRIGTGPEQQKVAVQRQTSQAHTSLPFPFSSLAFVFALEVKPPRIFAPPRTCIFDRSKSQCQRNVADPSRYTISETLPPGAIPITPPPPIPPGSQTPTAGDAGSIAEIPSIRYRHRAPRSAPSHTPESPRLLTMR